MEKNRKEYIDIDIEIDMYNLITLLYTWHTANQLYLSKTYIKKSLILFLNHKIV